MDTMTIQEPPICISYSRYSSDAQVGGTSIERQTREAAAWARANGYRLDTELSFQDEAKSAWSGEHAKSGAFSELLGAVRAGRIPRGSAVYIEAFDRLSRQGIRKTTRLLEDIIEHGVDVVVQGQVYDASALDDPMAMIMLVIRATEAKVASDDKSRRVKAAWTQKRENAGGKPMTKNGPSWLALNSDRQWIVIEDRADIVRRIFAAAADGHGALAICKRLNDDKVPTLDAGRTRGPMPKSGVRAGDWRQSTVKHLLGYRAVIGEYVSGDGATTVSGYWPAIVSEETFHAVAAVRATKAARGLRHDQAPKSIVAGLAVCAKCGRSMTRIRKGKSAKTWLVCTGARLKATDCGYGSVPVEKVEEALRRDAWSFTGYAAGDGPAPTVSDLEDAMGRVETLEGKLDNLLDTAAGGAPSRALKERIQATERELEIAREDVRGLQHVVAASAGPMVEVRLDRLRDQFASGDVPAINAAFKAVAKGVVVDRHAGEVRIEFHHGGTAVVMLGD
jgi:DNA invertase Pin-like site-specific DNA recombinase